MAVSHQEAGGNRGLPLIKQAGGALARAVHPSRLPPRARLALTLVLFAAAAAVVTRLVVIHVLTLPHGRGYDDSYIYLNEASRFVSNPTHLYNDAHHQVAISFAAYAFVHPPSGLIPYLPFVPLVRIWGLPVAASAWSVFDTLALFAAVILAARRAGIGWPAVGAATLLISITDPVSSEITQGQINGVVLLLLVLSLLRFPRRDSGVFMGLALAFKPVTVIVLLLPLLRRQWWVTILALLTILLLNMAFAPLIGLAATLYYTDTVLPYFAEHTLRNGSNISLGYALQRWFGGLVTRATPYSAPIPHALEGVAILWITRLAVLGLWLRACIDRRLGIAFAFAVTLATVPFLSSTIWPHYLVYLFPLALAMLASSQMWARCAGVLSLVAWLWSGRGDGLWLGIGILWLAAGAVVLAGVDWQASRRLRRRQALGSG